jgi:hypothetical protein
MKKEIKKIELARIILHNIKIKLLWMVEQWTYNAQFKGSSLAGSSTRGTDKNE